MTSEIDKINLIEKNRNNKNVEIFTKKTTKNETSMNCELKPLLFDNDVDPPLIPKSLPPLTPPETPPRSNSSNKSKKLATNDNNDLKANGISNGNLKLNNVELIIQANGNAENKLMESPTSENNTLNEASLISISTDSPTVSIDSPSENKNILSEEKFISMDNSKVDNDEKLSVDTELDVERASGYTNTEGSNSIAVIPSTSLANSPLALAKSKSLSVNSFDSDTIPLKLYDYLLELLRCPGCAQPMKNSMLCESGHSCCQRCILILRKCPLCKEPFTDMRSLTLEALLAKAQFTCSNHLAGCKVRFPIELLDWHEKKCQYKTIKCFMGRVWGDCDWQGRDLLWQEHLESKHMDKVFTQDKIELSWDLSSRSIPLAGYYVFKWKKEIFNLYQIYDKKDERCLWTIATCSSSSQHKKEYTFAYEIEIYNKVDESKVICQRFPCHNEQDDKDILQDGTCVAISISDLSRFMKQDDKIINYRVRLFKLKAIPSKRLSLLPNNLPIDYKQVTNIGANMKGIPDEIIITRHVNHNALVKRQSQNEKDPNQTTDSESEEAELTEFVNDLMKKKWMQKSLTTPNLNRRFWDDNYDYNSSMGSIQSLPKSKETLRDLKEKPNDVFQPSVDLDRRRKTTSLKRFRQSFKNFRHFTELRFGGNGNKKTDAETKNTE